MTKFMQMVHETKENLLWLLQGFVKGEVFFQNLTFLFLFSFLNRQRTN